MSLLAAPAVAAACIIEHLTVSPAVAAAVGNVKPGWQSPLAAAADLAATLHPCDFCFCGAACACMGRESVCIHMYVCMRTHVCLAANDVPTS